VNQLKYIVTRGRIMSCYQADQVSMIRGCMSSLSPRNIAPPNCAVLYRLLFGADSEIGAETWPGSEHIMGSYPSNYQSIIQRTDVDCKLLVSITLMTKFGPVAKLQGKA
jgi:hypothetical protein